MLLNFFTVGGYWIFILPAFFVTFFILILFYLKTAKELNKLSSHKDLIEISKKIKETAEKSMLSTKDLIATKGRASFLGERARGHIDPGARSSQLAIEAICNTIINAK